MRTLDSLRPEQFAAWVDKQEREVIGLRRRDMFPYGTGSPTVRDPSPLAAWLTDELGQTVNVYAHVVWRHGWGMRKLFKLPRWVLELDRELQRSDPVTKTAARAALASQHLLVPHPSA